MHVNDLQIFNHPSLGFINVTGLVMKAFEPPFFLQINECKIDGEGEVSFTSSSSIPCGELNRCRRVLIERSIPLTTNESGRCQIGWLQA